MATKQFLYKQQYGVIVICESEQDQIRIFEELKARGSPLTPEGGMYCQ
jgi:uncharacterized protein with ParB-like and HNH nuclease domain